MSKAADRSGAQAALRPGDDDVCPACRSSRYLNKQLRFLVNPVCYHKMCESCVDRRFSHGPATCPIVGCGRTLRRQQFRTQTFEDLKIEREVDIRRRMAKTFNRREDDFETLLDYNNYLNQVEDWTFNLINNIDVEETQQKIDAYTEEHRQAIRQNESIASQLEQQRQVRQVAEKEQAKLRREAALREMDEEKREREADRLNIINKLATGQGDAKRIVKEGQKVLLKRRTARQAESFGSGPMQSGITFKGLKQRTTPEPEKPYDPFEGRSDARDYYVLQDNYTWDWIEDAKKRLDHTAGGYDMREFYSRALCEAFAGLGVFIGDEMADKDAPASAVVGTAGAAFAAGGDLKMDEVF